MKAVTENDREVLRSKVARAIGTVKRFISILDIEQVDDRICRVRVKRRGGSIYGCNYDRVTVQVIVIWREVTA